jgi:hypothetical protein
MPKQKFQNKNCNATTEISKKKNCHATTEISKQKL